MDFSANLQLFFMPAAMSSAIKQMERTVNIAIHAKAPNSTKKFIGSNRSFF
jgi:hypothetical protein